MDPKRQQAYDLYQSGMSYGKIAKHLNISRSTAHNHVKEVEHAEQLRSSGSDSNDVRSPSVFDSFGTPRTASISQESTERVPVSGKVRVKIPAYVIEQKARLAELEERTHHLSTQLHATRQKQSEQLHRRCEKVRQTMEDNDGDVWTLDELDDCREQLESIREDLLGLDESEIHWIHDHLDPLIELLHDASGSLEEEDMDEGEIFFFEE